MRMHEALCINYSHLPVLKTLNKVLACRETLACAGLAYCHANA